MTREGGGSKNDHFSGDVLFEWPLIKSPVGSPRYCRYILYLGVDDSLGGSDFSNGGRMIFSRVSLMIG